MTIALPTAVSSGGIYVGQAQNLFARQGLDVAVKPYLLGKDALKAMLEGKADLAIVADTPFMFAVMRGEKIAALSVIFGSRRSMVVLARKASGVTTAKDLAGKTIGTSFGTNAQFFLDGLLVTNAVDRSRVKIVNLPPEAMVAALQSGEADAVTMWPPHVAKALQRLGDSITVVSGTDEYVFRFLLVGKQDYIAAHMPQLQQTLSAFAEANHYIRRQPLEARNIIAKAVDLDSPLLARDFDAGEFSLSLDQTLLLALDEQTRWAMKHDLVHNSSRPNYLDFIQAGPLAAIDPDAVKIIR